MGDPKFPRRSYDTPSHPWQGERIKEEAILVKQYGLKSKKELWKAKTIIREMRKQSRDLQARLRTGEDQARTETENLLHKCARIGLLPVEGTRLDDVLGLSDIALLERRLQTMVFAKGLAATVGQAASSSSTDTCASMTRRSPFQVISSPGRMRTRSY